MSSWTHVFGTINVSPYGRTQHECRYILETVLDHLPLVTGSERDMTVHILQSDRACGFSSHNEFGQKTNLAVDEFGNHSRTHGMFPTKDEFILVVEGCLRDRLFKQTKEEFMKWLVRLAKRVFVYDVLVRLWSDYDEEMLINDNHKFCDLCELPSWAKYKTHENEGEPTWSEYLMWESEPGSELPLHLVYKYYNDKKIYEEIERRREWNERFE